MPKNLFFNYIQEMWLGTKVEHSTTDPEIVGSKPTTSQQEKWRKKTKTLDCLWGDCCQSTGSTFNNRILKVPYSQHFIFFITYGWAQ